MNNKITPGDETKHKKIAVILFNLGGPDSKEAIRPFLFNLFYDKYILTMPAFFRYIIAWMISRYRTKTAQEIYAHLGNKSPILAETIEQSKALEKELQKNSGEENSTEDYKIFICMRHWFPRTAEVVNEVKKYGPDEIILLPLYPHFSNCTTLSSIEDFRTALAETDITVPVKTICCYPGEENFIKAHVNLIIEGLKGLDDNNYEILFSAHGLPKKFIDQGDPYQWQIEYTVNKIIKEIEKINSKVSYRITYQSRVGPNEWLKPNTEDEIRKMVQAGKNLIIVPVSFVSEHVETLVELDIEYKKLANSTNIKYFRIPTLSLSQEFIKSLSDMIIKLGKSEGSILSSDNLKRICPSKFTKCPCQLPE